MIDMSGRKMKDKRFWQRRRNPKVVVARGSRSIWGVRLSRRLIPGALFSTREAAIGYAATLAQVAGLSRKRVRVL